MAAGRSGRGLLLHGRGLPRTRSRLSAVFCNPARSITGRAKKAANLRTSMPRSPAVARCCAGQRYGGMELALYALGIGPGDEVVTTSRTFIASASCVIMRGATPVMADVGSGSQDMTAETIGAALTDRTRAIVAVHLAGWPCDMDPILELAQQRGLKVIEDSRKPTGCLQGPAGGLWGTPMPFLFARTRS